MEKIFDKKYENADFSVIKHNTLIESGYDLSPVPNNIMTIATTKARESNVNADLWTGEVIISAKEYSDIHKVSVDDAYKVLKRATLELEETKIICDAYYDYSKGEVVPDLPASLENVNFFSESILASKPKQGKFEKMKLHIRLVQKIGYSDTGSFVYLKFSDDVLHLIKNATNPDSLDYTKYDYANTIELNTTPAKRLYELVQKWKKVGVCKKQVDEWKILFGVFNKYPNVAEFKRRVLQPAIDQMNEHGEFELTLEQEKLGRLITHFKINIKDIKPVENQETTDTEFFAKASNVNIFESLTESERQIVKATADKYLIEKQIEDPKYKQNIYKKAVAGRWGLTELDKQHEDYNKQSKKVTAQIEQEQLLGQQQQQEREQQNQENLKFIAFFENLSIEQQNQILLEVKSMVEKEIPLLSKNFDKEYQSNSAHKDRMFRSYFKKAMGLA